MKFLKARIWLFFKIQKLSSARWSKSSAGSPKSRLGCNTSHDRLIAHFLFSMFQYRILAAQQGFITPSMFNQNIQILVVPLHLSNLIRSLENHH